MGGHRPSRLLWEPSFLGEYVSAPTLSLPAGTQTATCSIQVLPAPTVTPMRAYNIPRSVTLSPGRIEEGWTLMRPIILLVEREDDGWYVVSDDIFGVYGDAESLRQAVDQYASGLIDEYEFFRRESPHNPLAMPDLGRMRKYLQPSAG